MKIPPKFILQENECIKGRKIDFLNEHKFPKEFRYDHNDLLALINGFKPCTLIEEFNGKSYEIYFGTHDQYLLDQFELYYLMYKSKEFNVIPYEPYIVYDIEQNDKYIHDTFFVIYHKNNTSDELKALLFVVISKHINSFGLFEFDLNPRHYFRGKLLGYRDEELKIYYLRSHILSFLNAYDNDKNNGVVTSDKMKQINDDIVNYYHNTMKDELNTFNDLYAKFKIECDNWLDNALNESSEIRKLIDKVRKTIKPFQMPKVVVEKCDEEEFEAFKQKIDQ